MELEVQFPDAGRINHFEAYAADGTDANQGKSFFARLRCMVAGQHHFMTARGLYQYAAEAAWKEDNRLPNGEAFIHTIGLTMAAPVSRTWKGYWQRHAT